MKKIPSLFVRDFEGDPKYVLNQVTPGCEWVLNGEGRPTIKLDGTCCLISNGVLYKRYDAKKGKTPPENFWPAQPEADPMTGHWPGWLPLSEHDYWHHEGFENLPVERRVNHTYELIGPKIGGNPEKSESHMLIPHGMIDILPDNPRTFEEIRDYLKDKDIEGIVWHHSDGRMVKIKKSDFWGKR